MTPGELLSDKTDLGDSVSDKVLTQPPLAGSSLETRCEATLLH